MAVTDWRTEFDHTDPTYSADPFPIWDELRTSCPIARSERFRGMWVPTTYADMVAIAHDPATFSSRSPVVTEYLNMAEFGVMAPPISSDPPYHTAIRRLLLPYFAPRPIEALRPKVEALADELIDAFIEADGCDAAVDYAQHIPVRLIAHMLGVPESEGDRFRRWVHDLLEVGPNDMAVAGMALMEFFTYFREQLLDRRANPGGGDLVSYLAEARITAAGEGQLGTWVELGEHDPESERPLSDHEILGVCLLLLLAGIDTTWSSIGATIWHLAQHPEDRERLVADPDLWPIALEEFLRAYAPVTMARELAVDADFGGCPMHAGDPLLLPFPAANRDPEAFPDPDEVRIDRAENRHVAFGVGIHRCLGSNLARLELQVAVQRFIERVPSFRLADPDAVTWSSGQVRGPRSLPLRFDR